MSTPTRTTNDKVIAILSGGGDYDVLASPDISPYVETASAIVDLIVECATRKGVTISDTVLELQERWIGAHLYAVSDKPYSQRQTLRASISKLPAALIRT